MVIGPTQTRIGITIKAEINELLNGLGIDLSNAVDMSPRQCIPCGGLPFEVELPRFSTETLAAMEEARRISRDPNTPSCSSIEDLRKALLSD